MKFFKYLTVFLVFSFVFHFSLENKKSFANQNLSSSNTSLKPVKTKNNLDFYTQDLMNAGKNVTRDNYESIIYQTVCPYMNQLKSFETKGQVDQKKRKRFLETVVGLYDQALNWSSEHYLVSCIYHYYGSLDSNELADINKKFLSKKNQQKMKKLLNLCAQEQEEGNGDDPKGFIYSTGNQSKTSLLLPLEDYEKLSEQARLTYIQKIKSYYLDFEREVIKESPTQPESVVQLPILNFLIMSAVADEFKGKCLIGGVMRKTIYSKKLKRRACPIFGRACNGSKNNFQCGDMFNNKCISINPVGTLSNRCYKETKNEPVSTEQYEEYRESIQRIISGYCTGKRADRDSCTNFVNRNNELKKQMGIAVDEEDTVKPQIYLVPKMRPPEIERSSVPQEDDTEAAAPCIGCHEQNRGVAKEVEGLRQAAGDTDNILNYFSDNIFENSTCKCTGNDGCTRGCRHDSRLQDIGAPPATKCKDEKPMDESTSKCARHVRGAIMDTIHHFLAVYCEDTDKEVSKNRNDYNQCVNDFKTNREKNICEHGFIFHSALCALNLDGQSADAYNNIDDPGVKKKCEFWNEHNEALLSINIKQDDGTIKSVPLFKKISPGKMEGFQKDPSQIPTGSIIVSKSPGEGVHGHVEIKTNKNKCGPGNNQTCFCSDFCKERKNYKDLPVQAVFQWNPEIIKHIEENY